MDNERKNESFFTGLLNKTRKDKIFIVILAGILMMVIAMPTKSSSAKSYTVSPVISSGSDDYEKKSGGRITADVREYRWSRESKSSCKNNRLKRGYRCFSSM